MVLAFFSHGEKIDKSINNGRGPPNIKNIWSIIA